TPWEPPCDAGAAELCGTRIACGDGVSFRRKGRILAFEMKNSAQSAAVIALAAIGTTACAVSLDHEELDFDFAEARPRCVVAPPEGVSRSGAFSLALPQGSYFIFGETWVGG